MVKMNVLSFLFVLTLAFTSATHPLLQLINRCDRKDANLQTCLVNETNRLMKIFINGLDNFVPNLLPFKITNLTYENDYIINLSDGNLHGLDTFVAKKMNFPWNDKKLTFNGFFNILRLQSNCRIVGNVLDRTVNGKGTINIVMENVDMFGNLFLTFIRKEDNEKHVKYIDNRLHLVPKNVKFAFSGLFDDVAKENEFNNYINANIEKAKIELLPIVEEILNQILIIMEGTFHAPIPYKDFFLNFD